MSVIPLSAKFKGQNVEGTLMKKSRTKGWLKRQIKVKKSSQTLIISNGKRSRKKGEGKFYDMKNFEKIDISEENNCVIEIVIRPSKTLSLKTKSASDAIFWKECLSEFLNLQDQGLPDENMFISPALEKALTPTSSIERSNDFPNSSKTDLMKNEENQTFKNIIIGSISECCSCFNE